MDSKEFQSDNLLFCFCTMHNEVVRIKKKQNKFKEVFGGNSDEYEYYSCPKAHVIMTKQPLFSFFYQIMSWILDLKK